MYTADPKLSGMENLSKIQIKAMTGGLLTKATSKSRDKIVQTPVEPNGIPDPKMLP